MGGIMDAVRQLVAPRVGARLDEEVARQLRIESEILALALPEFEGVPGTTARRQKLEKELVEVRALVERLRVTKVLADRRDTRQIADAQVAELRAGYAEFEKLMQARIAAAARMDAAVSELAAAFFQAKAGSQLVSEMVPAGLQLPDGYVHHDVVKAMQHALHKHSRVAAIGDRPMPGSASPSFTAEFDAAAIPTTEETVREEANWLLSSMKRQIDMVAQLHDQEEAA